MTLAEVTSELLLVDAAITKCLEAQSYSIAGRSKTNAALSELYKRKNYLEMMKTRLDTTNGGAVRYPVFGNTRG